MWKTIKKVSAGLAIVSWFSSFLVWTYYDLHRPKTYMPKDGRIFPLDTHGSVVYITASEHYFLYGLIVLAVILFAITVLSYFNDRQD